MSWRRKTASCELGNDDAPTEETAEAKSGERDVGRRRIRKREKMMRVRRQSGDEARQEGTRKEEHTFFFTADFRRPDEAGCRR